MTVFYDGAKIFWAATLFTVLSILSVPVAAQLERSDTAKIRVANPAPAPTQLPAPNILQNTMVSGCDSGWKRRRDSKLCIDLEEKDSFKLGEPISFKITTRDIPKGKVLFVSLSRLSIVSLPYSNAPVEGYSGGIPLLPTPEIQANSSFTYTWDGTKTHCYWTDTGNRCDLAKNLVAGRYILKATLLDTAPSFGENVETPSGTKPIAPIASVTRAFTIDAPLNWSQYIRTADRVAKDYAYGQLKGIDRIYADFKDSIEITSDDENFVQEKNKRWCRRYIVSGVAKGTVKACLPPYIVSEYGLWQTRDNPTRFVSSGDISYAEGVRDLERAAQEAGKRLDQLYAPVLTQPNGVLSRSIRLERLSYSSSDKAWSFFYDVKLDYSYSIKEKLGLANTVQEDAVSFVVSKSGAVCLGTIKQERSRYKAARYILAPEQITKMKCFDRLD